MLKTIKKSYLIRGCIITIKKCICTVLYDLFPVCRISLYHLCIVPLLPSSTLNRLYPDSRSSSDVQGTNTCYNKSINTYSNHSTAVQILMASQNKLARIIHFFFKKLAKMTHIFLQALHRKKKKKVWESWRFLPLPYLSSPTHTKWTCNGLVKDYKLSMQLHSLNTCKSLHFMQVKRTCYKIIFKSALKPACNNLYKCNT